MIDRARDVIPGLRSIEVVLDEATEEMPSGAVLWAHRDETGADVDSAHRNWIDWLSTLPPDVSRNFSLLSVYHGHGR